MAVVLLLVVVLMSVSSVDSVCQIENGVTKQNTQTFQFPNQPCVTYQCNGETYDVKEAKCYHGGECIEIYNTAINETTCEMYECKEQDTENEANVIGMVNIGVMCKMNNKCYADEETFEKSPGDPTKCTCNVNEAKTKFIIDCP